MVRTYAQLYLDARSRLMQQEDAEMASQLARHLVCFVSGKSREAFLTDRETIAPPEVCLQLDKAVQRICNQEPLAYVLGEWSFYGLDLYVNPDVLIPRDDTCPLVDTVLNQTRSLGWEPRILDLCTGSGCIGLALASRIPSARVTLADISEGALAVAKKNVSRRKLGGRACCVQVDALRPAPDYLGKFHAIVSNPPYITTAEMETLDASVREYEPHLALCGGEDGLAFYRSIVENFTRALRPGGFLAFEFGEGQGNAICDILEAHGYTVLERANDYHGTQRAVLARYDRKEE